MIEKAREVCKLTKVIFDFDLISFIKNKKNFQQQTQRVHEMCLLQSINIYDGQK